MKFFNRIAAPIAATAWATAVFYIAVKEERSMEEQRKQQYVAHGEKPPTKFIGIGYKHTPPREPKSEPTIFKIGL